jgi:ATP phosphoribosyltransferase regulatory subunit
MDRRDEPREQLAMQLGRLFGGWGYRYVEPPLVEDLATFRQGSPGLSEDRVYRFLDRDSRLLALRPDMTAGIARLVAQGLGGSGTPFPSDVSVRDQLPLRLRYEGSVFRNEAPGSGRSRAIRQAGVELIGEAGPEADAEVIALAVAAGRAAGADGARLVIGHVALAWGVLALAGAERAARVEDFRRAINERDLVALADILGPDLAGPFIAGPYAGQAARDLLDQLAQQGGDLAIVARQMQDLLAALPAYGVHDALLDLALLRDLDYYSGVVFEIIQPGRAEPLAGGGRYDRLIGQFGLDLPATGFALNLDVAAPAVGGLADQLARSAVAWATSRDRELALAMASSLRTDGTAVETMAAGLTQREAIARATARGVTRLLYVANGAYRELRLDLGRTSQQAFAAVAATGGIH